MLEGLSSVVDYTQTAHVSNEKKHLKTPSCLGYLGDEILNSYMGIKWGYNKPLEGSLFNNQYFFFVAHVVVNFKPSSNAMAETTGQKQLKHQSLIFIRSTSLGFAFIESFLVVPNGSEGFNKNVGMTFPESDIWMFFFASNYKDIKDSNRSVIVNCVDFYQPRNLGCNTLYIGAA